MISPIPTSTTISPARAQISTGIVKTAPRVPLAWYLIGAAADLKRGTMWSRQIGEQSIVIFRTESGALNAVAATCWHMGAHLGQGQVCGEFIRCGLHHWEYDGTGACRRVPGSDHVPPTAKVAAFPVAEQFGMIFVFNHYTALFPVPHFANASSEELLTTIGGGVTIGTDWFAVASNAFDRQHLETVHERALREVPTTEQVDPFRYQYRYVSRVIGHAAADKVMQWLSNDTIHATITSWGGPLFMVETDLGRVQSTLLVSLMPAAKGTTVTPLFAFRKTGNPVIDQTRLATSRWLFESFLMKDVEILEGMKFSTRLPLPGKEPLAGFLDWLDTLPDTDALAADRQ